MRPHHTLPRASALALAALILSSLACQTLLGAPALEDPSFLHEPETKPTQPSTIYTPSLRLDGLAMLPDLEPGPRNNSPQDMGRPQLSGTAYTLDTQNFRVHYTLQGQDAVPAEPSLRSAHPQYVIEVARALEYSWTASIDHFGWAPPPPDYGLGGDDRYDVYLQNIMVDDYAGYTEADAGQSVIGDNPRTPLVEQAATHTYIVLDNDYLEDYDYNQDGSYPEDALNYMRSTAAHEFHHAIQFGYDGEEPHDWVWEATSTWIEEELFDTVNDPVTTLSSVFHSTDTCQLAEGGEYHDEDLDHWYGMWILMRHLSEQYGHEVILRLWEHIIDLDGYAAWDALLAEYNTTLEDVFMDYSIALLTRDFEEGKRYPWIILEGSAQPGEWFVPDDGIHQLGADYIYIPTHEPITVTLEGADMFGVLVGIAQEHSYIYPLRDGTASMDAGEMERTYLIVMNMARANSARSCRYSDYQVNVALGGESQEPEWSLPAPNFMAARLP